jgi:selenocysteine lyase/cysteine desulfurase
VVVTRLDHDANIRPWVHAAAAAGATVRWADFDRQSGELAVEAVTALLGSRTRVVAVTGASNLLGTRPDVPAIASAAHAAGALLFVDGVHLTPHAPVDCPASARTSTPVRRTSSSGRTWEYWPATRCC